MRLSLANSTKAALIDREDYPAIKRFRWTVNARGYVQAMVGPKKARTSVVLHNALLWKPKGMVVDHINRDPLDNRRGNLRICTAQENAWNRAMKKRNKSGFRGVTPHISGWQAQIVCQGKTHWLGSFRDKADAARAYDAAARRLQGKFAVLNFPVSPQPTSAGPAPRT